MKKYENWIVIGGDSMIGHHLGHISSYEKANMTLTTRKNQPKDGNLFFDLDGGEVDNLLSVKPDVAFICAGVTNMHECEEDPKRTSYINVDETERLILQLVRHGVFVIYLSSNTVFDGKTHLPDESFIQKPTTEYGLQKYNIELKLANMNKQLSPKRIAIVRLTKVFSYNMNIVKELLDKIQTGEAYEAFDDLKISPISVTYVTNNLLKLAKKKLPGIFHLSGEDEISYAALFKDIAIRSGFDPSLIVPVQSKLTNKIVLFQPLHPALGMARTKNRMGIQPQEIECFLEEILGNRCNPN